VFEEVAQEIVLYQSRMQQKKPSAYLINQVVQCPLPNIHNLIQVQVFGLYLHA